MLKWTLQVSLSSASVQPRPSAAHQRRVERTLQSAAAEFPDSSPNNMQMGLPNACLHICGIVHD